MADSDDELITYDNLLLILILFTGIVGTGVVRWVLGNLGYNGVGRVVFAVGYGAMVFVLWYGWIRPLDITGPSERERSERERGER
ncbi:MULTISPECIES: hypothetical protein [Haloprofundus]|uniref:hypothetical protein n=1 Tax=Haloprofundus TaxID=1911573 RepID=UPI000E44D30F|nr:MULTISPECIES: hypothetical protein [Haloprofundus]QCJ46250.1 hypothetical protein FCF25_03555 [Haloprofundus sp. MHR1]